jgi:hypothetical protein
MTILIPKHIDFDSYIYNRILTLKNIEFLKKIAMLYSLLGVLDI